MAFVPGMKVRYALQPEWGVGHLVRTFEGGTVAEVLFPGRSQPTLVSTRGNTLIPHPFVPGDRVRSGKGREATITGEEPGGRAASSCTEVLGRAEDGSLELLVRCAGGQLRKNGVKASDTSAAAFDTDQSFMLVHVTRPALRFRAIARSGMVVDSGAIERQPSS